MFSPYDVSQQRPGDPANEYPFGIAVAQCAAALRKLADEIEQGRHVLQKVESERKRIAMTSR